MDIRIEISTDLAAWDQLNGTSKQGSPFCSSTFVEALGLEARFWFARYKGRRVLGAIALFEDGNPIWHPTYFTMYQGLLLDLGIDELPVHSRTPLVLEACRTLAEVMTASHERVSFSLHPTFPDVRAFQWFNHSSPENGQFRVLPRYTGILSTGGEDDAWANWLASIRDSRRAEHAKAIRLGLSVETLEEPGPLLDLYVKTFGRHDVQVPKEHLDRLHRIARTTITGGSGLVLQARQRGGPPLSAALFLRQADTAFYLVGANDPEGRNKGSGSFLMIEAVKILMASGVRRIDMCGANSPHRGDFKTSLNAEVTPYFDVAWLRPGR